MTATLCAGAVLFTFADSVLFALLVVPGHVRELNPLVAGLDSSAAISARVAALVALLALAVASTELGSRLLTIVARLGLVAAIASGVVGAVATAGSLS